MFPFLIRPLSFSLPPGEVTPPSTWRGSSHRTKTSEIAPAAYRSTFKRTPHPTKRWVPARVLRAQGPPLYGTFTAFFTVSIPHPRLSSPDSSHRSLRLLALLFCVQFASLSPPCPALPLVPSPSQVGPLLGSFFEPPLERAWLDWACLHYGPSLLDLKVRGLLDPSLPPGPPPSCLPRPSFVRRFCACFPPGS